MRSEEELILEKLFEVLGVDVLRVSRGESLTLHSSIAEKIPELKMHTFDGKVYIDGKTIDQIARKSSNFVAFKPARHFGVLIVKKDALRRGVLRVDRNDMKRLERHGVKIRGAKRLVEVESPFLPDWEDGRVVWRQRIE